jgi:tetratricopeptide (TPR) repeat protein
MSEISQRDRDSALITQIVEMTIKGQIRSKEQLYQMLVESINPGTREIFERCLGERLNEVNTEIESLKSSQNLFSRDSIELKQAKLTRTARALQSIENEYSRWEKENKTKGIIALATQKLLQAEAQERVLVFVDIIDQNQDNALNLDQLQQLSQTLKQTASITNNTERENILNITIGIEQGLTTWKKLEAELISWIYELSNNALGFELKGGTQGRQPWAKWLKLLSTSQTKTTQKKEQSGMGFGFSSTTFEEEKTPENLSFLQGLLKTLASDESILEFAERQATFDIKAWIEVAIVFQYLQRGLVAWFEKQPYNSQWGKNASISMYLTFAVIWCQLYNGCNNASSLNSISRQELGKSCFQVMLQILRAFAQKDYFPLYGGIFALFSQEGLRDTINYLDEPLRQVEKTQEKARILTLLGVSQRIIGQYDRAMSFHQEALEIARNSGDRACEIANYNHQSRIHIAQKNYTEAINGSQRALILARQGGDKLGEANALVNLGYSEVFEAQQIERMEPEIYERAIEYLQQGLKLSQKLEDGQSLALCYNSLGIAYTVLGNGKDAIEYLAKGAEAARISGDLYLQGLNFAYQAEAFYAMKESDNAIAVGCLGMYLLEQINANEWRNPAALMMILQGQLGADNFKGALQKHRSTIIQYIGVDGYDYLPELLDKYRRSLEF